jgi:hypothetical protein
MTTQPTKVYFGKIADMIAEVGALDMGAKWFKECGYRWAVLPEDASGTGFDTEYFETKADAMARAKEYASAGYTIVQI